MGPVRKFFSIEIGKAANIFAYTLTILSAFKAHEVFIKLKVLLVVSSNDTPYKLITTRTTNAKEFLVIFLLFCFCQSCCFFVFFFHIAINKTRLLRRREMMTQYSQVIRYAWNYILLNWIMLLMMRYRLIEKRTNKCKHFPKRYCWYWVIRCRMESSIHKFYLINTVIVVSWH